MRLIPEIAFLADLIEQNMRARRASPAALQVMPPWTDSSSVYGAIPADELDFDLSANPTNCDVAAEN